MNILKFGGTSVGSADNIKHVAELVMNRGRCIVVLSAMAGVTNTLVEITEYLYRGNRSAAKEVLSQLVAKYTHTIDALIDNPELRAEATERVMEQLNFIHNIATDHFTLIEEKEILARGELMSTAMMDCYLRQQGVHSIVLQALEYMRTDKSGEPDSAYIKTHLRELIEANPKADVYLTEGYICRNAYGDVDNLTRGGSDYTASLIGAAIGADEIQIWTDIDGMHNNDPRYVEGTDPVRELHFEEAAELAYFGAKILHPTCVLPAKYHNIPVRLLNTMQPQAPGTLIHHTVGDSTIKAVAAKDNITAIKIKSSRMLLAYGFMRRVFEIFESYHTPIDMVTTSEVGVSVTIDSERNLDAIVDELRKLGSVTIDRDMVIICVVGDLEWHNTGLETRALDALRDIPVRMISYGGSNYNISLLIHKSDKIRALQALSDTLFCK